MVKTNVDLSFLFRKKKFDQTTIQDTKLSRVLGLMDITALGVSCTLGNGIYVLAGDVIAKYAGPSIFISFLVAGLATFIAGICYAEFGARVPRSGSAYVYIFVTIGEFVAFILGWTLILEYVIGVSSSASALSKYIDTLCDMKIRKTLESLMPINVNGFAPYPDFLAFALVMVITAFMVMGVKESTLMNKLFTLLNIAVIAFIVACGSISANIKNWDIHVSPNLTWNYTDGEEKTCNTTNRCGDGGFTPFGFDGIIKGAAKCFYAYIGFDAIASAGEEVNNPKRNIPLSIVLTLLTVSLCYCSTSIVLTLMIPYYIINPDTPLPQAFDYVNLDWANLIVSIGAIASLATCLYASMFPMPRVVYSLASDGLIFKRLAYVLPKLKTPVAAAVSSGLLAGFMCLIFDLDQLIDMMSIGTLLAYSVVAICVLILRYRPTAIEQDSIQSEELIKKANMFNDTSFTFKEVIKSIIKPSYTCNNLSSLCVNWLTGIAVIDIFFLNLTLVLIKPLNVYGIVLVVIFVILLIFFSFMVYRQPQDVTITTFKIPLIYIFPFVSVFINTYLMMALEASTWIRFSVWFALGMIVYFSYGIRNSTENAKNKPRVQLQNDNDNKVINSTMF